MLNATIQDWLVPALLGAIGAGFLYVGTGISADLRALQISVVQLQVTQATSIGRSDFDDLRTLVIRLQAQIEARGPGNLNASAR